ncbi:unnamed protein product [Caenorhabditis angaria]|uniref:Uncharacterized protein n=1 Tax=Caenorhabditis angaria TaxID=860376 RepID=A0A9P1N8H3_9PELO|nr:unnamed protein product [Caenorhabditis angaria]
MDGRDYNKPQGPPDNKERKPEKKGTIDTIKGFFPSWNRTEVSQFDIEEQRREIERIERLRRLEEKTKKNYAEREQRYREQEESDRKHEEKHKEREDNYKKKLQEIEQERTKKQVETDQEFQNRMKQLNDLTALNIERQNERHARILDETEREYDLKIASKQRETQSIVNIIQQASERNSNESKMRQQQTIDETNEHLRLADERRKQREQELEELREKTRIELEKSRIMWEERKRQLEEQMEYMEQMMIQKLWSIRLENQFTNRLDFLRTSGREILRNYTVLIETLNIVKRRKANGKEVSEEFYAPKIQVLQNSLDSEKELMQKESENIGNILFNGQWVFLYPVKNSLDDIVNSCANFSKVLSGVNLPNLLNCIAQLKDAHVDLCLKIDAIPTFNQLKATNYQFSNLAMIEDEPSQFRIEEIE